MTPREHLTKRGIAAEADLAGWQEGDGRWLYPIFNLEGEVIAHRGKAYPSNSGKFKYTWFPEKPKDPASDWYILLGTANAIAAANGVAWLANGEPASLAYKAAGVHNVLATTLSEISLPRNLKQILNALGITRLLYPVDNDAAGMKSAIKWRDALRGTGIDYQAFTWGEDAPNKADGNDIWIALEFDAAAFQAKLKSLESVVLPEPIVMPKVELGSFDETPRGLIDAVAASLGIQRFRANGWSVKNVSSPFREDKEPSAGFNQLSGVLHDFGTEESYSIKEVAERLGIDWKPYYPKKPLKPAKKAEKAVVAEYDEKLDKNSHYWTGKHPAPKSESVPLDLSIETMVEMEAKPIYINRAWIDQDELPYSWVKAILHLGHSKSVISVMMIKLHRAIRGGLINPESFTISDLIRVLGLSRNAIQGGLDTLIAWTFLLILSTTESTIKDRATEQGKKSDVKMGRPEIRYALNCHTDDLRLKLMELIEPKLLEVLSEKDFAPRTPSLRESLDLDLNEFRVWHERVNTNRHDYLVHLIQEWSCDIRENDFAYSFTDEQLESPAALRGFMLKNFISQYPSEDRKATNRETGEVVTIAKGVQISNAKLALMLGCSVSSVKNLVKDNGIGSEEVYGWYEVENPNQADIRKELREAPYNFNRELGGRSVAISLRPVGRKTLKLDYSPVELFEQWDGRIEKLHIWIQQPSRLWVMTEQELNERAEERAAKEAVAEAIESSYQGKTEQAEVETPKEKKTRKPSFVSGKDRIYTGHSYDWKYEQLALETHLYTPHKLSGLAVLADNGEVVAKCESMAKLVEWLNQNAAKTMIRTVESYYNPTSELVETAPRVTEATEPPPVMLMPKPSATPVQKGHVDYPLDPHSGEEYHDYLNNPYLGEWERENRKRQVEEWRKAKTLREQLQEAA
jgi:uncharacterized protein with FMN-binding domain